LDQRIRHGINVPQKKSFVPGGGHEVICGLRDLCET